MKRFIAVERGNRRADFFTYAPDVSAVCPSRRPAAVQRLSFLTGTEIVPHD